MLIFNNNNTNNNDILYSPPIGELVGQTPRYVAKKNQD